MLGERLYTLRKGLGLSQEQLAERIGVSRQTISKWEGGLSTPDLEKLMALAECFGVSLDVLVGKEPPAPAPAAEPPRGNDAALPRRLAGLGLCVLGLVCLVLAVVIGFFFPQARETMAGSIAVTIDGCGVVFGMCILAVIAGVYLIIRSP